MAKWLVVKLADEIPEKKMFQLLNNVAFHEASTWYESAPDVFNNSKALDKARRSWLTDRHQLTLMRITK